MRIVVMNGGHNHHSIGPGGAQLANQAFAVAVGQAPINQRQAVGVGFHHGTGSGQRGYRIDLAHGRQGQRQKLGQPFARLIQVFNDQGAGKTVRGGGISH